ncbi:hypothetical protein AB0N07_30110 [Streptomyces sp. NPDC051172]|uniref:hypothetical protein n=1 Tax=Streptomyces sp. NPDC051172 TaxID=3155796 RepID=UPI0034356F95
MGFMKSALTAGMGAAMAIGGLTVAPAAHAESGNGGCYQYTDMDTYPHNSKVVIWKSCIGKKANQVGHPYAIFSMGKKHPKCKILITAVTTGEKIVSKKVYPCPSGQVVKKRFDGNDFHGAGQFTTFAFLYGIQTEGNLSPRSPWLNL